MEDGRDVVRFQRVCCACYMAYMPFFRLGFLESQIVDVVQCQVVTVDETVYEEWSEDCGHCEADFEFGV